MTSADFTTEYSTHFTRVQNALTRFGASRDAAQELSQQAWARAWEKREQFTGSGSFVAWVIAIAYNYCYANWREQNRYVPLGALDVPTSHLNLDDLIDARTLLSFCSNEDRETVQATEREMKGSRMSSSTRVRRYRARHRMERNIMRRL